MRIFAMMWVVVLAVSACTGKPSIDDPKLSDRQLKIEEFFRRTGFGHGAVSRCPWHGTQTV